MREGLVRVQCKDCESFCSVAKERCAVVLGINSHSVVIAASFDWIRAKYRVSRRIDFGNFVRVSQVDIHLFATKSYCGMPVSLLNESVLMISSLSTSTTAIALPKVSATYTL